MTVRRASRTRSDPRRSRRQRLPSTDSERTRRQRQRKTSRSRSPPRAKRQRKPSHSNDRKRSPWRAAVGASSKEFDFLKDDNVKVEAPDLPVKKFKEEIVKLLAENRVIIVVGETGSGKTTQIPQYIIDSPEIKAACGQSERPIRVAITQPRRVATVAMAKRVSQERGALLGGEVGYTIRFDDKSSAETRIRYMTDGVLMRECLGDRDVTGYDVVVLDEAHERSLQTDVLFALMKVAVARRQGKLRLLVTSATLNTKQFSTYFGGCPVLEIPGRNFKVDLHYHPVSKTKRIEASVNVALNIHMKEGPGHLLVFLTGMDECEQAVAMANEKLGKLVESGKEVSDCLMIPLYGMMQSDSQRNVFGKVPDGCRKVIFSTNIAETSLTIDGVGFVIDCGYVKQKNYNAKTGMESLDIVEISQVQAVQRSGRAGRTQAGKCFRLYSEDTFNKSFLKATTPEILRSNLVAVTLQLKSMGIDDVLAFDFIEPPDKPHVVYSLKQLFLIGALDEDGCITDLGNTMVQFPLEPQYSRVLIEADRLGCAPEALTLVSMLSSENIYYRPSRQKKDEVRAADIAHQHFFDISGDHVTLLRIYDEFLRNGTSPEWAKRNFLHHRGLRQARDIREQLCEQIDKAKVELRGIHSRSSGDKGSQALLKALCSGFFMQTARLCGAGGAWLTTTESNLVQPEPGSVCDGCNAEWLLYTELIGNTMSHCTMRTCSAIDSAWLKPLFPRLEQVNLKRLTGGWEPGKKKKENVVVLATAEEREVKTMSAKERFLARKAAAESTAKKRK